MKLKLHSLRQGMASLTLVLIVVTLISLIMLPIFLVTYIRNTQAVRFYHSQQAFFAAEGAYSETVGRLKLHDDWGRSGVNDTYLIGPNEITRTIMWLDPPGEFQIAITANNRLAQRKIEGVFTPAGTTTTAVDNDIMFLLDYSSSMSPDDKEFLKQATKDALGIIALNPNNRAGVVVYGYSVALAPLRSFNQANISPYDPDTDPAMDELYTFMDTDVGIWTNTGDALDSAINHLNLEFDSTKKRTIILFSDGVPNRPYPYPAQCGQYVCMNTTHPFYLPARHDPFDPFDTLIHYGNICSHYAITTARNGRSTIDSNTDNITIYSVYLPPGSPDATCQNDVAGQLVMFEISSDDDDLIIRHRFNETAIDTYNYYKQITDSSEISNIFTSITDTISTGGSASYGEAVPD